MKKMSDTYLRSLDVYSEILAYSNDLLDEFKNKEVQVNVYGSMTGVLAVKEKFESLRAELIVLQDQISTVNFLCSQISEIFTLAFREQFGLAPEGKADVMLVEFLGSALYKSMMGSFSLGFKKQS